MSKMGMKLAILSEIVTGIHTNNQYLPPRQTYKPIPKRKPASPIKKAKRKAIQKSKRINRRK